MRLRKDATQPILTPERGLNPPQDLYLYPFSDSFNAKFAALTLALE